MTTRPSDSERIWISLNEAAEYLGVAPKSVRRYIADGRLRAYRLAGKQTIRIKAQDLDALMRPIPTGWVGDAR